MYSIDTLVNANKYTTKKQIFNDIKDIAWFLEPDLKKIILKSGKFIGEKWFDFLLDSIEINITKLQKKENDKTVEFWDANTSIRGALKIVQSMIRSEIQNGMDRKRGGKPLINEISLYNVTQLDDLKRGDDSAIRQADAQMDAQKIAEMDPKTFTEGLQEMLKDMIFEEDPQDLLEQIKYLCKKYGFEYQKIVPNVQAEFNKMVKNGEIKIAEDNQMFFDL